jgi:general secretion pathway protein C
MNAASWLDALPGSGKWRSLLFTRGPRVAIWVLGIALGVQAALIVTNVAGAGKLPAGAVTAFSAPRRAPVDIALVTNAHLFGFAPGAGRAGGNVPRTSMPLVLTGVIAASDPRDGLAILGPSASAAKVYAVGDSIPGGASLHSVLADHVLLERDGHLESLALPRQLPVGSAPAPSLGSAPTSAPLIERMRQLVSRHPEIIGDVMRPEPVFAGGHQVGFRVYPGRDRRAFQSLGLQPGDLVTAIDGTPLDDPAQSAEILHTLGSSSEAQVTILRNGKRQDLSLNLAQVEQEAEALAGPQNGAPLPGPPGGAPSGTGMMPFGPPQHLQ